MIRLLLSLSILACACTYPACVTQPAPLHPQVHTCQDVATHIQSLFPTCNGRDGRPLAGPTALGTPWDVVCSNAMSNGEPLSLDCIYNATSCEQVLACTQ